MCSERLPWRCHRKIISDALAALGFRVIHILGEDEEVEHKPTSCYSEISRALAWGAHTITAQEGGGR